jgi:hypothetical protein
LLHGDYYQKKRATEETGSHYPDVSDAVNALSENKLIKFSYANFRSKRRPEQFYKITLNGFKAFIYCNPSPSEFWEALDKYCKLCKGKIGWNTFDSLYLQFEKGYLGYSTNHGYFFQFEFVDRLFDKSLKDNKMRIYVPFNEQYCRIPGFVMFQRVLECLGMNRLLTLEELCRHIEEQRHIFEQEYLKNNKEYLTGERTVNKQEIERVLERYSLSADYVRPYRSTRPDLSYEYDQRIKEYVDFVQHLVVTHRNDKDGYMRYELSLFGIALLLSLKAYYFLNPEMLFYNNITFEEYCKRLALNYKDKLPLVFGKWEALTNNTFGRNMIAAEILNHLFYNRARNAKLETSILLGGVKEHYEGIEVLTKQTFSKLKDIHDCGRYFAEQLGQSENNYQLLFSRKLDEIYNLLRSMDLEKFMEGLWDGSDSDKCYLKKNPSSVYEEELMNMERAYADEISFLYYIFLYVHDPHIDVYEPVYSTYFPTVFKQIDTQKAHPPPLFLNIINTDNNVREMVVHWTNDSAKCQTEVQTLMSYFKRIQS